MIRAECLIFAGMLAAGAIAGAVAAFLLFLGKGSRVARVCFDLLAPPVVGVFFFFGMQDLTKGAFRLYALLAFLLGMLLSRVLLRKISPLARRVLRKILLPMKSLVCALEGRVDALLEPLRAKGRERRKARALARAERREEKSRRRAARSREREARSPLPSGIVEGEGERNVVIYNHDLRGKRGGKRGKRRLGRGGADALGCQSD